MLAHEKSCHLDGDSLRRVVSVWEPFVGQLQLFFFNAANRDFERAAALA